MAGPTWGEFKEEMKDVPDEAEFRFNGWAVVHLSIESRPERAGSCCRIADVMGPFWSYDEALEWERKFLRDPEDEADWLTVEEAEAEESVVRLTHPEWYVQIQLGDEPGQFSVEGAIDLMKDMNPGLKPPEKEEDD